MTKSIGRLVAMLVALAVALPLSAGAQEIPKKDAPKAAPARPAAPPAAARPAPPVARPAPPPVVRAPVMRPAPPPVVRAPAIRPQPPAVGGAPSQRAVAPVQRSAPPASAVQQQRQERFQDRVRQRQQAQPPAIAPQLRQQVQTPQQQVDPRRVLREERALRRREDRALRALPPQLRAVRREEIRRERAQRIQQRQQAQPSAVVQPNLAAQPDGQAARGLRRSGAARVTQQAARQGRFAAPFAARSASITGSTAVAGITRLHAAREHPRRAWRRGLRAAFVPWYGPVFWPYAYSDVFDYAFWPYGYDDGFWFFAYDDFFDGVFWGEVGPPEDYAYATPRAPRPSYAAVQALCKQPGTGITAWPFAEIERKVGLNDEQKQLLGDVRTAAADAAAGFKASCPPENAFPMTPPGRLTAMTARIDATLQAVQTVRPALERFYGSLSDEQKERFNQIGPKKPATSAEASQASADTQSCKAQKPGLTNLPIERIEDAVKPTDAQAAELKGLEDATAKAVSILQAACPDETPITPPGRLEAMEKRLRAMADAARTVKPALENFYGSLSSEQKARFNRIGRELAQSNG